jgi:hypothetical protein
MYCVFADIGQAKDYPAQGIIQHVVDGNDPETATDLFVLRWIERIPLGTAYRDQVKNFKKLMDQEEMHGEVISAIDGGGVGRAVLELFHDQDVHPMPITFTAGSTEGRNDIGITVPKTSLVQGFLISMETGRFIVAEGMPDDTVRKLQKEMRDLTIKVNPQTKHATIEAGHEETHDDMIMAICLGLHWLKKNATLVEDRYIEQKNYKQYNELNY